MNKLAAIAALNPSFIYKVASLNPLTGGLMGAGIGAGAGAGYTYLTEKDPEQRKNKLKTSIMTGALIGGTGGSALGMLANPSAEKELEQLSHTAKETKYDHRGVALVPPLVAAGWGPVRKLISLQPGRAIKNVLRYTVGMKTKPFNAKPYKLKPGRLAALYLLAGAASSFINKDVITDMARAQEAGDTTNVVADSVINPLTALLAYKSRGSK